MTERVDAMLAGLRKTRGVSVEEPTEGPEVSTANAMLEGLRAGKRTPSGGDSVEGEHIPPIPEPKPRFTQTDADTDALDVGLRHAATSDTAQEAHNRKMSRELGIPRELIPEDANEQLFLKQNDAAKLQETHPAFARFMANKENAAIVGKDTESLKGIESVMRRFGADPLLSVLKTAISVPQGFAGLGAIARTGAPDLLPFTLRNALESLSTVQGGLDVVRTAREAVEGTVDFKRSKEILDTFKTPEQQAASKGLQDAQGFMGTLDAFAEYPSNIPHIVLESIGPMLAGGAFAQALVKQLPKLTPLLGGAIGEGATIAGATAEEIRGETEGSDLSRKQALLASGAGIIGTGIGVLGGKIMSKLGVTDIDTALADGTLKQALNASGMPTRLATRVLTGGVGEGVLEEMPQSAVEQIAQNVALEKPWDEGLGEAMATGLVAGAATGAGVNVITTKPSSEVLNRAIDNAAAKEVKNMSRAQAAVDDKDLLESYSKVVSGTALRSNDPEAFKEFVRTMAEEDGTLSEVYVDAAKFSESLAQSGLDPKELLQKMPELEQALKVAHDVQGEVRISIEDYATFIAGSKAEVGLIDHLRTSPEGMTFGESQTYFQQQEKSLTEQAAQLVSENSPVPTRAEFQEQDPEGDYNQFLKEHENKVEAFAADSLEVHDTILKGLNATGRFTKAVNASYAIPFQQFFAVNAARQGVMPSEMFKTMPLNFRNMDISKDSLTQPSIDLAKSVATPEDFTPENIKNILSKTDWMVITASNPNDTEQAEDSNVAANAILTADLKASGTKFEEITGRYSNDTQEHQSFLVFGISREQAALMARKYNQEAVLTREGFTFQNGTVSPTTEVFAFDDVEAAGDGDYSRIPSTGAVFAMNPPGDALTVRGAHFSKEKRSELRGDRAGTGIPAAERNRLLDSDDPRISQRIDFYSDSGNGITPEAGLGGVRHDVLLTNIYDGANNPRKFKALPGRLPFQQSNDFETQVLNAGFDGYIVEQGGARPQGRVVLLGAAAESVPTARDDTALNYGVFNGQAGTDSISETQDPAITGFRESDGSLQGLPRNVGGFEASHYGKAEEVAIKYMEEAGLDYHPPNSYAKVDKARAKRIADAFEAMEHNPNDPMTKAAYAAMISETTAQYKAIVEQTGLEVEFVLGEDPYAGNPRAMTEDVRRNNHMWVFSTRDGFGTDQSFDPKDNPLLAETNVEISGQPALANDLFRMVHDYFGHVKEGVGFRAAGEENTWRSHAAMFTPLARRALTTETRGQNSWLNFGPFGATNRTAKVEDTHFADQKIGLLPEWASEEGRQDLIETLAQTRLPSTVEVDGVDRPTTNNLGQPLHSTAQGVVNFWKWFKDSEAVDSQGRPLVLYHSTLDPDVKFNTVGGFMGFTGTSGISLTDNRELASRYLERFGEFGFVKGVPNQPFSKNILPVYAATRKTTNRDTPFPSNIGLGAPLPKGFMSPHKKAGFDTAVFEDSISRKGPVKHSDAKNAIRGKEYVLTDPTQVKSAIGNIGAFSAQDPNILAQSRTLRTGQETLKRFGLAPGQSYKTREVAAALQARQRKKFGTIPREDQSPAAQRKIANWMVEEVLFEMEHPNNSGIGWYSEKYQAALDVLGQKYPELLTEENARSTMTALIAVASDGAKVSENLRVAEQVYAGFRENGRFKAPTTQRGSLSGNLKVLQGLYDKMGTEAAHQYLMKEDTLGNLKKKAKARGAELNSPYQADINLPMAALEFGPKLGAFYANLMGSHGFLTMDRWWSRTFNRYRGTLLTAPTEAGMMRFKELLGRPETMTNDEVLIAVIAPQADYEGRNFKTRLAIAVGAPQPSTAKGSAEWMKKARNVAGFDFDSLHLEHQIERAANTIHKKAFVELEDVPFSATDRTFMLAATEKARKSLGRKGHDISTADIQAILWYYEKKLYGELGAQQSAKISYEEAAKASVASGGIPGDKSAKDNRAEERVSSQLTGRLPLGEELYQFGGPIAATADKFNLERAKELANTGLDNEDIRQLTGWFQGVDDKWRFEIDDSEAMLASLANARGNNWRGIFLRLDDTNLRDPHLGDVIRHPKLFAAYPDLAFMRVGIIDNSDGASFNAGEGSQPPSIKVGALVTKDQLLSIIMHEVQHGLQNVEGFARGGSVDLITQLKQDQIEDLTKLVKTPAVLKVIQELDKVRQKLEVQPLTDVQIEDQLEEAERRLSHGVPEYAEYKEVADTLDFLDTEQDPVEGYRRLAGEIEARNTQERLGLDEGARAILSPESTQDLPNADAIVIFRQAQGDTIPSPDNIGDKGVKPMPSPDNTSPLLVAQGDRASYNPATFTISLMNGADLSSTIHEGAHFYLEALADMATRPGAPEQIKADFRKTMDWFGIKESWNGMTLEEKRTYHEQWAQSFERYALEGKAPTTEMQPVFARFRTFMLSVYKDLKAFLEQNPLAGKLNDEIRSVFDRLLAAEEGIRDTERAREYAPLFATAEEAGTTQRAFEEYLEEGSTATERAIDDLSSRSLRDMRWLSNAKDKVIRALQAEAKDKREAIRAEVINEVMAEPINRARTFLRSGVLANEDGTVTKSDKAFKLDTKIVKQLHPDADLGKMRGMTSPKGEDPDFAAQMFGFNSGDALVNELLNGERPKDRIDGLTDALMLERHGDLIDNRAVERAAEKAIHNEARARFMATGLKMLTKSSISAPQLNRAAKQAAESAIAAKKVREITPGQYARAEARANKEAIAKAAKDPNAAIRAQRAALLNNRLVKASTEAQAEVDRTLKFLRKFDSANVRKKLEIGYVEQIMDLLGAFDLKRGVTQKALDKRVSLADWIIEQQANGYEPALDPALLDDLKRKHYKDMTLEELRGLVEGVKQIEHLGRLKKKLLTAKDKREFAVRVDEADASIRENANRTVKERGTPTDMVGKTARWARQATAGHRKFNSTIREMDGGKDGGVMWKLLSRPLNEAGDFETQMKQDAAMVLDGLFKNVPKEGDVIGNIYVRRRIVPGTNISMTHENRVMFAVNWGNAGNRQRLLDGGMAGHKAISTKQAEAILDTLTLADWTFVQGVLDHAASFKERVAALEKQITGVEPEWVEPTPITTKFGTFPGGYFPAKYDAELSTRSESLEAVTDSRMGMKAAFGASATRSSFAQKRATEVIGRPIKLTYDTIAAHISEVTHRLAFQPFLIDANRLMKALDEPIRKHYGPEVLREMSKLVDDVAEGGLPAKDAFESALNHIRTGATIVGLGWRFFTALLQPTGLAQSWVRIGPRAMARGVAKYLANPRAAARFVDDNSLLMKDRGITMIRELNDVLNTIRSGEKLTLLTTSFFTMIQKMQRTVDIPTWLGAQEKFLEELGYENAVNESQRKDIYDQATQMANQAVIDSQSGGQLKDLARVQRGGPAWKLFTNFFSYLSATYNLNIESVRRTNFKSPMDVARLASDLLMLNTVPVILGVALKEMLRPECGDDTECLVEKMGREQISFLMGQTLITRELSPAVEAAAGFKTFGYQGPAGLRFLSEGQKLGVQIGQGEGDVALIKAINSTAGVLLHYPAGQVAQTVEGIIAIENGEVEGEGILPALLAGPPK